jgi:6-phosphogluconolactonase
MNGETGVIEDIRLAAECVSPSYLAKSPSGKFLYAVNEAAEFAPCGAVSAFAVAKDGALTFLNHRSSAGSGPCHVTIHRDGAHAVVANYGSGVIAVLPIDKKSGFLGESIQTIQFKGNGPNAQRQEKAHAHSFAFDTEGNNGFACDLGSDKVMTFRFDKKSDKPLIPWTSPFIAAEPGQGPRHGLFHSNGGFAYVLNELGSTVDVLKYTVTGGTAFEKIQHISALPKGYKDPSIAAAIRLSADGRFLYVSNRGHNSSAVFRILRTGLLELMDTIPSGGRKPRDLYLDPAGTFLVAVNTDSDNLAVFRLNRKTGLPKKEREYAVLSPVSVLLG